MNKRVDIPAKNEPEGDAGELLLVNKPAGWTSFDIVHRVRGVLGIRKVGHAGTLDPLATGLLIIGTGRKTRELDQYQGLEKEYDVVMTLGAQTASLDTETPLVKQSECEGIDREAICSAARRFIGYQTQIPPMFSAVKVKGKRLYKYARRGQGVQRPARQVFIRSIEITDVDIPDVRMTVVCSKGTYIRSLVDDIGRELGCGAFMRSLVRKRIGHFLLRNAVTIEELECRSTSHPKHSYEDRPVV